MKCASKTTKISSLKVCREKYSIAKVNKCKNIVKMSIDLLRARHKGGERENYRDKEKE
jgi:hypothetical protein